MKPNKLLSRLLYTICYFITTALILYGLSQVIQYFSTGATDSIYNVDSVLFEKAPSKTEWLDDDDNIIGDMNKYLRKEIEESYAKAWHIKNLSHYHKKDLGLKEHFTKFLQDEIKADLNTDKNTIETTSRMHNLKLHLISFDKQIVSFSDFNSVREIKISNETENYSILDTSSFKILMTLDEGKWRVKKLHKIKKESANYIY